jgi:pimeloyl-ACP methyl ester carboxylesterase
MNKSLTGRIRFFYIVVILLAVSIVSGQTESKITERNRVPRFEDSNCPVPIPGGVKAVCGTLFVRENRQKPAGRVIKLPLIIIKSTAPNPAPDPLVYTGGGPGASSLGRARSAGNLVPFTKERDFIIFEQRGTRFAEPSLQCPEVNAAIHQSREQNLTSKQAALREVEGARQCRQRLTSEGVELAAYDSAASAADLEDLRRVLGINKWNLYGISYSTRLMLNYIREYGANVRSVVLDSVLPPTANWDETGVDGVMRSLNVLFENCARDAKCADRYPRLEGELYRVIKTANQTPITIDVVKDGKTLAVKLDGNAVFDFVYNLLEDGGALSQIPSTIYRIGKGDHEPLRAYAEQQLTSDGFIWGMRYSVWCREEMPFENIRKIAAQAVKYPAIKGFKIQGAFPEICRVWNVPPAPEIENQPVKSNIPALVFAGEYDPDTPPAWSKSVASWFSNAFFYEVKSATHGAISNRCTWVDITAAFVSDPTVKPNDACLSKIAPLDFK